MHQSTVCVCLCAESVLELTYTLQAYTFCGLKGASIKWVCVCVRVRAESALELTNTLWVYTFCGFNGPWFHFKALVSAT